MKKLLYLLLLIAPLCLKAQDSVMYRIIYIGDAGENSKRQGGVIGDAQNKIVPGKTSIFYLGDNIYPLGMGLPGTKDEKITQGILKSQYEPMRAKGAPVYFIPGNHDWDRMGPKGLAKIKREWEFIDQQKDSLLKVVPADGCPGPYEIKINDKFTVIAFDSEWWLYIYSKNNPSADCDCRTEDEIIAKFRELLARNRDKVIMLADHHPFWSYGHHGGYYDIMDYFFPLTSVQQNLYVPMPGIGALYPFLRGTFSVTEDQGHPLYKTMIERINGVFNEFPNVVYVSGHEHGIQFIKVGDKVQIVSGAGAKEAFVKKGRYALYAKMQPGYVTADLMRNKSIRFTYYATADSTFKQVYTYTKPYVPVKPPVIYSEKPIAADSVLVSARPDLDKVSAFHRKLYGENYRKEWAAKVKLPVLHISKFQGGLTPVSIGGNHQAHSLRLKDNSGKEWLLSSIEKYPVIDLPESRRETFAKSWLYDAISAKHPYAALVAPVLATAVKVGHTNPVIGYISPDHKLGIYEKEFAKTICILEESKGAGETDNTGKMMRKLDGDNDNRVDTLEFFRARLLDWFVGDWDQQQDQWRWSDRQRGKHKYYSAIPRDRDQAFFINEGVIPWVASRKWMTPYLRGYSADKRNIIDFFVNGRELDVRFLSGISYGVWMQTAEDFQQALTDQVLEKALRQMPAAAYKLSHQKLLKLMKYRRDHLVEAADIYYQSFNKVVDVKATNTNELFLVKDTLNNDINLSVYKISKEGIIRNAIFSKVFDHRITKEIRIYASRGQDSIYIDDQKALIKVRVIGGAERKSYYAASANKHTKVYDKQSNTFIAGPGAAKIVTHFSDDSTTTAYVPVNRFSTKLPLISLGFNPDDGLWIDAGAKLIKNGFRHEPGQTQEIGIMHTFGSNTFRFRYNGTWFNAIGKADFEIKARLYAPNSVNFFGIGNEMKYDQNIFFYRSRFDLGEGSVALRWHSQDTSVNIRVAPTFQYFHLLQDAGNRLIYHPELIHSYDSATVNNDKFHAGLTVTYVDDKRNSRILPAYGVYLSLKFQGMTGLNQYSRSFFQFTPEVQLYKSVTTTSSFVIMERLGGGVTFGQTAFYQSMFLGGTNTLPGFRENRFAGRQMLYNNLEGRVKINTLLPYILPGQFGVTAGYGVGRIWDNKTPSNIWHNSVWGGFYFFPSDMALLKINAAYSADGFYPYITLKLNM